MRTLLVLAWRNVWRNRRRSLITISAIVFSVLIITLTRALQYGSYDAMEASAVRMYMGEIQIQRPGYKKEQTLEYALGGDEETWRDVLDDAPWIRATTRRLTAFGLVSSETSSAGAMIIGIEPEAERKVSEFTNRITVGLPLRQDAGHEALLGQVLARNLRVEVGDTVVVITQGWHNQMGADLYRVRGLLRTGSTEMDRGIMILTLPDAQLLFSMEDRFTEVVLRTDNFRHAPSYAESIQEKLPDDRFSVFDWDALMPELRQMILLDNVSGAIYLFFLLVLVGFEIFNTTTMSVMERAREFGVLQALGMRPRRIASLVLSELTVKILVALVISMGASGLLLWYLAGHPIPMPDEFVEMYEGFGYSIDSLVFSTKPAVFIEPLVSVAIIAVLATIYPVVRVLHLTTIDALRRGV